MELTHKEYLTLKEIVGRYENTSNNPNVFLPTKELNKSILDMNLSVRLFHVLKNGMGIKTIRDMIHLSVSDYMIQRNFGKRCLEELEEVYQDHGLKFVEK